MGLRDTVSMGEKDCLSKRGYLSAEKASPTFRSLRSSTGRSALILTAFLAVIYVLVPPSRLDSPTPDLTHILTHLRILDRIVDYHNGTRAAHGTGYEASARYVETVIKRHDACDRLERQEFTAPHWRQRGPSQMWAGRVNLTEGHDFSVVHGPSAEVSGTVVWLRDHGCPLVHDFSHVGESQLVDRIVAIERPSLAFMDGRTNRPCSLHDVVLAAQAKGAKAVIMSNTIGDLGFWPFRGVLDVPWFKPDGSLEELPQIPVLSVSWTAGTCCFVSCWHSMLSCLTPQVKFFATHALLSQLIAKWRLSRLSTSYVRGTLRRNQERSRTSKLFLLVPTWILSMVVLELWIMDRDLQPSSNGC